MKKIAGLVVVLTAVTLGSYYGMGVVTEKTLKNNLATMNDPQGLAVDFSEYHRGWFKSDGVLNWKLHVPARSITNSQGQPETIPAQDFKMLLPINIYHGPFIFADGLHFGLGYAHSRVQIPAEYMKQFDEVFTSASEKPKFDINIFVNYLNRSTINFSVPAFKVTTKEGDTDFEWKGMSSSSTLAPNANHIAGDFHLDGFHATSKNKTLAVNMSELDIEYDLDKTPNGYFLLGTSNLSFPSFTVTEKDKTIFAIHDFKVKSESEIDDKIFDASLKLSLDKIEAQDKIFGPGDLDISISNLDAESLMRIHQHVTEMQQGITTQQQSMMVVLPEIPKLLSQGPELEIAKFHFTLPEGTIDGNMKLSIPKDDNANPMQMMQKMAGHGKLTIPTSVMKSLMLQKEKRKIATQPAVQQALVNQLQKDDPNAVQTPPASPDDLALMQVSQHLTNMTNSGLIVLDGNNYVMKFELKDGKFMVNDRPFTPAMMQF